MLFVFGKRAKQASTLKFIIIYFSSSTITSAIIPYIFVLDLFTTQMRLNKVSELIHNSTNHQNLESAGVSVHFQEIIDMVLKHIILYINMKILDCIWSVGNFKILYTYICLL